MKSPACTLSALLIVFLATVATGCATTTFEPRGPAGPPAGAGRGRGATALGIPPGQLPPPGECRIWIPGRPPGQQAPPGRCGALRAQVPPGAWLISSPGTSRDQVQVAVYDARRPSLVVDIRFYERATGLFIRAEVP